MRRSLNPLLVTMAVVGTITTGSIAIAGDTNNVTTTNAAESTNVMDSAGAAPSAATTPSADLTQSTNTFQPRASDHGGFGIGAIVGEPTGLSLKYWLSDRTAVDAGAAWSFEDADSFHLHADFLMHKFDLIPVERGELPLYFGVGGRIKIPDHGETRVGVRLPVGIAYEFQDMPLEVFAEVAPVIDVAPATQLRWNGGVGVRYYFR